MKKILILLFFISQLCLAKEQLKTDQNLTALSFSEFDTVYSLQREGTLVGEINRTISHQDDIFTFRSVTQTTGLVSLFFTNDVKEETQWRFEHQEFKPLAYDYYRDKNGKIREVKIDFDWENQKIITQAQDSIWKMDLESGTYDKLLYEIVIMQRLNQGAPLEDFQIADGGGIKTYSFEILGEEVLSTPIGDLNTLKIERKKSNTDTSVLIWYAVDKQYVPVKVQNVDKEGKTYIAMIKKITFK